MKSIFDHPDRFINRHIGPNDHETELMLREIGVNSIEELIDKTVPKSIRLKNELSLEKEVTENEFLAELWSIAQKNTVAKSYIGLGYNPAITPAVILRNILENPGWYTQYTPYQAEISQGRLEALLNFQTVVSDLTGLPLANASLLDEATAAAEAMLMFFGSRNKSKKDADTIFVSDECLPQTIEVIETRAEPKGIKVIKGNVDSIELNDNLFAIVLQYPTVNGEIKDYSELVKKAKEKNIYTAIGADILSLALLTPPGEFGADVAFGNTQRLGIPLGFGGPHAAYFATTEDFKRVMPGRIIGVSVDRNQKRALRMALQTREQHIKRDKATSNICTAQVLLAIMASMYAVYHGKDGIRSISFKIHNLAKLLNKGLKELGFEQNNNFFFDTLHLTVTDDELKTIKMEAESKLINFRYFDGNSIGISINERTSLDDIHELVSLFASAKNISQFKLNITDDLESKIPEKLLRKSDFLTHEVFQNYHSETEMLRYIKNLEKKDLSLATSMIPLGSCTMKLNAASEMLGLSWPEITDIHPFVPENQAAGYYELIGKLEEQLKAVTGFAAISFQPNSGAQGEYAGLMVIRQYHISRGDEHRDVILIPSSAHGTNPASAVMAGGKVVVVKCDDHGNIDLEDLRSKAEEYKENLSSLMVTYPSTHGVFEEAIIEMCDIVHQNGGLVYMDGANMNAQMGLTSPAAIGADVCHLNLHKTFAIPHGGGGPGMGPIGVAEHLVEFLPGHRVQGKGTNKSVKAVSAAHFGSASVLTISYGYIRMTGAEGIKKSAEYAIFNANYIRAKLEKYFKVLYTGTSGFCAHELIFDMREFKHTAGVTEEDIAKRLMDYGFHAPTVSFPVAGTLMVEPTESESKYELDRFCTAMIKIREEIDAIAEGTADKEDNLLKNAPHTAEEVISSNWNHLYSREKAAFPADWTRANKFWPSVARVNNAFGDRNLFCTCPPLENYTESE